MLVTSVLINSKNTLVHTSQSLNMIQNYTIEIRITKATHRSKNYHGFNFIKSSLTNLIPFIK